MGVVDIFLGRIRFRPASWEDLDRIKLVQLASIRGISRRYYTKEQLKAWCEHVSSTSTQATSMHLAELVGPWSGKAASRIRVIGFGYREGFEIRGLYVDPWFQGRGIAKRLLETLEEEIRKEGFSQVHLNSSFASECYYIKRRYEHRETQWIPTVSSVKIPTRRMCKAV